MVRFTFIACLVLSACGPAPKCPDVSYGGTATDEVFGVFKDAESLIANDDKHGPIVSEPTEKQAVSSADAPLTVRWPKSAARHLPPVTGEMSWLRITPASKRCRIDVLTSEREATLSVDAFAALASDKGIATVEVVLAYIQDNRIIEGPYRVPVARTITVK